MNFRIRNPVTLVLVLGAAFLAGHFSGEGFGEALMHWLGN
jgi:hypothetical protein